MSKIKPLFIKIIFFILDAVIVVLSALPMSSVLKFGTVNDNGEPGVLLKYYSSFDPTNLGYANFGPFVSAYLAAILLAVILVFFFLKSDKYKIIILAISTLGFLFSLIPFLIWIFTPFNAVICCLWLVIVLISSLLIFGK
ncbi:MAG: hypothetical protein WCR67_00345 [Bacilli bacterium]